MKISDSGIFEEFNNNPFDEKLSEGLVSFWRELFQSQLGYDVKITCDPNQIQDRHNFLNK